VSERKKEKERKREREEEGTLQPLV